MDDKPTIPRRLFLKKAAAIGSLTVMGNTSCMPHMLAVKPLTTPTTLESDLQTRHRDALRELNDAMGPAVSEFTKIREKFGFIQIPKLLGGITITIIPPYKSSPCAISGYVNFDSSTTYRLPALARLYKACLNVSLLDNDIRTKDGSHTPLDYGNVAAQMINAYQAIEHEKGISLERAKDHCKQIFEESIDAMTPIVNWQPSASSIPNTYPGEILNNESYTVGKIALLPFKVHVVVKNPMMKQHQEEARQINADLTQASSR